MSTATTATTAATYSIDPSHSSAGFKIRHCMVAYLRGEFSRISGDVTYDPTEPANIKIAARIDATTFYTREEKRDLHMKSAEFFDVESFPTIDFVSRQAIPRGNNRWKITGDLKLHGITKEVTLDVESAPGESKDLRGVFRTGASATTVIKRSDFGLTFNVPLETGGVLLSDEVFIELEIELVRKS